MIGEISPSPTTLDLASFRHGLDAVADTSTIGVSTAEGVSPKNAALERLAWSISRLPTPDDQVTAMKDILRIGHELPDDQNAHMIANMIHDLVMPGRIMLHDGAQPAVGQALLQAGLQVAPHLVVQSPAYVVLKLHLHRLVLRQEYAFRDEVYDLFDEVGFNSPTITVPDAAAAEESPLHKAEWLYGRILLGTESGIEPATLSDILDQAGPLPDDIRGAVLTALVNVLWRTGTNPDNAPQNARLLGMVNQLPPQARITALEAYYNQMNVLPHTAAAALHPTILAAVTALPADLPDVIWFARSRNDLIGILRRQAEALAASDLGRLESLQTYNQRHGIKPQAVQAPLFTQMRQGDR